MKTFINYKDCLLLKKEGRESLWCAEFKFYRTNGHLGFRLKLCYGIVNRT